MESKEFDPNAEDSQDLEMESNQRRGSGDNKESGSGSSGNEDEDSSSNQEPGSKPIEHSSSEDQVSQGEKLGDLPEENAAMKEASARGNNDKGDI